MGSSAVIVEGGSVPAAAEEGNGLIELIHLATNGFTSTRALLVKAPAPSPSPSSPASHSSPAVMDLFNLERDRLLPESAPADGFGVGLVDEEEDEARPTCLFKSRLMVSVF